MEYTYLGRTGLQVSRLCLGTMNFGPLTTEADSYAIMDKALELGINFFDTANVYGWKKGEGVTEKIIGRWFAQGGGRREKVVLATKVYGGHGRLAQRKAPLGPQHQARLRSQPQAPANRPHRPLPDAPHRPQHPLGRGLAGDGAARPRGQDDLRGQQQLRRVEHRPGQRNRQITPLHGPGLGAEPLQPGQSARSSWK